MTKDEALKIMVERIAARFNPERIILFGSQARGDAEPDSDMDILVVLHSCENRHAAALSIMQQLSDLPVGKDIVVATTNELETRGALPSTILYPALREGITLYAG